METKQPISLADLAERLLALESSQQDMLDTLRTLLPIALTLPTVASDGLDACRRLISAIDAAETLRPRTPGFMLVAQNMLLVLTAEAIMAYPEDTALRRLHDHLRQTLGAAPH